MGDQSAGFMIIMSAVSLLMLGLILYRVVWGMALIGFLLAFSGFSFFAVARGGIHEATGAVLIIGGAICAGIAGSVRKFAPSKPSS